MAILLGIDTGGTYTDAVLLDEERGVLATAKALTTKDDLAVGIRRAVRRVVGGATTDGDASSRGAEGEDEGRLARTIRLVSLSTTLATNAIVEGQGSPSGLLLVGYDPAILQDIRLERILPRENIAFIGGGHTVTGEQQEDLDNEAARQAILALAPKVAAFGISGYFGVRNPAHELAVRQLVRDLTSLPVTCGHELTSRLDAPRRALTVALNARLVPFIRQLILSVREVLRSEGIKAPLMVVKGDGSLVEARVAMERPVETILSGPAASVVGARFLSGADDALVIDMGGTTTDIAAVHGGQPVLSPSGARVGGWQTMVEAIEVHTSGLGGDSEVRADGNLALTLGPRRVVPLSLLAVEEPRIVGELRAFLRRPRTGSSGEGVGDGTRFLLRQRSREHAPEGFSGEQEAIWERLRDGAVSLASLLKETKYPVILRRALDNLLDRGLVVASAFTPTDAVHALGLYRAGSTEAAQLAAEAWAGRFGTTAQEFCQMVVRQVGVQAGRSLVAAALAEEGFHRQRAEDSLGWQLIDRALGASRGEILGASLTIRRPLVAIGAPVATYFPAVAATLQTPLTVPSHAEVANAIGAVAGSVVQTVRALIRRLGDEVYRVHLAPEIHDFASLEEAAAFAAVTAGGLAEEAARQAGAAVVRLSVDRKDVKLQGGSGGIEEVYVETEVIATAAGRPRLGNGT